jgi:heparosan-N-sulfate-glucuronate 5-epimerase
MSIKNYLWIFVISVVLASVIGNYTERTIRGGIEKVYGVVMGKPMVYDISQCDEKGIPYLIEGTIGRQRNPMTVCNKALSYHDNFIQGDSSKLDFFLNCANWLLENQNEEGDFSVLNYNYNWPVNNLVAPWRSGLANGVALQVLIKAHAITRDEKYLQTGKKILNSFFVEVRDGGVTYKSENNGWWFEEYADDAGYVSRVLNGHMFALVGIHEYFNYTNDSSANDLFLKGLTGLKENLPNYDKGDGNSLYDALGRPTNIKYHNIHIDLLDRLFQITNDPIYKVYRDKWKTYIHPSLTKRLVTPPVKRIDVAIWLVSFAIVSMIVFALFYLRAKTQRKPV